MPPPGSKGSRVQPARTGPDGSSNALKKMRKPERRAPRGRDRPIFATGGVQMKKVVIGAVLARQAAGVQAAAPAATVSAADPGAIAEALDFAGYKATIATDDLGDPMISTELNGWPTTIYFYGCDDTTHQGCDALRLEAGFDRATPWNGDRKRTRMNPSH